jgi:hypothetical protein
MKSVNEFQFIYYVIKSFKKQKKKNALLSIKLNLIINQKRKEKMNFFCFNSCFLRFEFSRLHSMNEQIFRQFFALSHTLK